MRLIYLIVTVTVFLSTIAQRRLRIAAKSNDTQPFTAESSEGNSSDNSSLLFCNITNTTEYITSQDCLCVTEPTSTRLGSSATDAANEPRSWRCAFTNSSCPECDGSTEPCRHCLCDGDETCHCMLVNSTTDCNKEPESESPTLPQAANFKKYSANVLLLVPLPDSVYKPAFDQGGAIIPAVQLAAEQINERNDILSTIHINVLVRDSGCDKVSKTALGIVTVLRELYHIWSRNGVHGIIGPACSEESDFVNTFFNRHFFDVAIPVFYSGTSPFLSENAKETPNAFGMISSATVLIDALIGIADKEEWNWKNIAVFYDGTREFFQNIYDTFIRRLNDSQQIGYTRQISDSRIPLKGIIDTDIRIVIVFSGKTPSRQLACLAGQSDVEFVFPIRQFIFLERTLEDFLEDENAENSFIELTERKRYFCDKKKVMRGLNGSVLLNQALDSVDPDVVTVSNYTVAQVKEQYRERLSQYSVAQNSTFLESIYAYPYYDAMWAFAFGWVVVSSNFGNTFDAANYAIHNNVSFQGVSSWIEFRNNGDQHVSTPIRISQVNESNVMTIALYNKSNLTYPPDVFINDVFMAVNILLHPFLITVGFLSVFLSIVFTVVVQVINMNYRNHPTVKASSPVLNQFIFLGCYLFEVATISSSIPRIKPQTAGLILCNLDPFCSLLAYCFIISTVLTKSWRTYRIFSNPFKHKQCLKDSSLVLFIMGCVFLNTLLIIPFFVLGPFKKSVSVTFDNSQWPPIRKQTTVCSGSESFRYIIVPLLFQLLLTIATVFLATLNRSIKRPNFRTTKHIFVFVYLLALTWALGGPLLMIFHHLHFYIDGVYSLYIFLLVFTVFLSLSVLQMSAIKLCMYS